MSSDNEFFGSAEADSERRSSSSKHRSRSTSSSNERMEEEIRLFLSDNTKLAREVIQLRKEISRLHFKVKNNHRASFNLQVAFSVVATVLLAIIAFTVLSEG